MPFKKGEGGRQRGAGNRVTKAIRESLAALSIKGKDDAYATRLHQLTLSSDEHVAIKALALACAYRDGKPIEHHQISGEGGGPVRVRFVDAGA